MKYRGDQASAKARILGQAEKLIEHKEDLVLLCVVYEKHVDIYKIFLLPAIHKSYLE